MKRHSNIGVVAALLAVACVGSHIHADTLLLKDGTTREGKILSQSPTDVQIRVNEDGMQATITVSQSTIAKITLGNTTPPPPAPAPSVTTAPLAPAPNATPAIHAPKPVASAPTTRPGNVSILPKSRGFMVELGFGLLGMGSSSVSRLPPDLKAFWDDAVAQDAAGKKAAELDALRNLEQAFSASPEGLDRLDGITLHERQQSFGTWMANVHYDVMVSNNRGGNFDVQDIRDVERPALIGLMKEKTQPAIDPLKSYFPPIDPKTDKPVPFNARTQLAGISVDNAIDIKDKALLAHALILGQIKLEPDMPAPDKVLLYTQLGNINHIVSRASELEPQARAKQQAADRAKAKTTGH
jgi:hypothetical protein